MAPDEEGAKLIPTDADIKREVSRFRQAIDQAGSAPWTHKGIAFPRGACGHASELLGRHLIDVLMINPDYVNQTANTEIGGWAGSHAWLEWNGIVMDITGDQFGWAAVIVTRQAMFHGHGEDTVRHPVCLPHQQDWWNEHCRPLWEAIVPHLAT